MNLSIENLSNIESGTIKKHINIYNFMIFITKTDSNQKEKDDNVFNQISNYSTMANFVSFSSIKLKIETQKSQICYEHELNESTEFMCLCTPKSRTLELIHFTKSICKYYNLNYIFLDVWPSSYHTPYPIFMLDFSDNITGEIKLFRSKEKGGNIKITLLSGCILRDDFSVNDRSMSNRILSNKFKNYLTLHRENCLQEFIKSTEQKN